MKPPVPTYEQLRLDCDRAFVAVSSKRVQLLMALDQGKSQSEVDQLLNELDSLVALWSATAHALIGAAKTAGKIR